MYAANRLLINTIRGWNWTNTSLSARRTGTGVTASSKSLLFLTPLKQNSFFLSPVWWSNPSVDRYTVRLLTHVLCKPIHFFFQSFIATMSYSLQTSFNSLKKDWADKYHVWGPYHILFEGICFVLSYSTPILNAYVAGNLLKIKSAKNEACL